MTRGPNQPRANTSGRALPYCRRFAAAVPCWLVACCLAVPVEAHPISVTEAFVYVRQDRITATIDVFVEDLYLFHNLQPNAENRLELDVIQQGMQQHKQFLLDRFIIRDVEGNRLAGQVVELKEPKLPAEGLPMGDLMSYSLSYVLEYQLEAAPEFLTISQQLVDDTAGIPAEMQLRLKQENAGSPYVALLNPGQPERIRLDWDSPPLSADASEAEWEAWLQKQREATLGITSYSSVYSFLYIEDYEIRHEILVPFLTLESSLLVPRDDDEFLDLDEQAAARRQIEAYFISGNPIQVDQQPVTPTVQRVDFFGLDFRDFAMQSEPREVSLANARVGIILSYPCQRPPTDVQLQWDRFSDSLWSVRSVIYAYDQTLQATFSRYKEPAQNVFQWARESPVQVVPIREVPVTAEPTVARRIPLVSVGLLLALPLVLLVMRVASCPRRPCLAMLVALIGLAAASWPLQFTLGTSDAPAIDGVQAKNVFTTLHHNVYRAFDYQNDEQVYDALARSVDGPLLEQLFLQIRQGLVMQEQGGAISKVREVEVQDANRQSASQDEQLVYQCRWNVNGTVEHWGHIHSRTNQYEGRFTVESRGGSWKITDLELLNEERLKFETRLRGM